MSTIFMGIAMLSLNLLILALFVMIADHFLDGRIKKKMIAWFDKKFGEN